MPTTPRPRGKIARSSRSFFCRFAAGRCVILGCVVDVSLRSTLAALTDALATGEPEDVVLLDRSGTVSVDSTLDDVDARSSIAGKSVVPRPDGLWEWQARRDWIRALPHGDERRRLSRTLAGPRTKRRFALALDLARDPALVRAFRVYRRRRLRGWAARVLRFVLARGWQ